MKQYIDEINNNLKNIRTAIKDQGADIDENTPLDEYAEKIESIEKTKVTVGHTIIPFYCYADNYFDASENKAKPEITWNSDTGEWDVKDNENGWTRDVPNSPPPEKDSEPLLYAMFVPIKYEQNSNDDDFKWPTPIQIQGKQGEKGDTGRDGRDGVIAGMVQYLAAHLFKVVKRIDAKDALLDVPNLEYDYVRAKNKGQPEPEFLYDPDMKDENGNITSYINSSVNGSNNNWGLSYTMPTEDPGEYVVLKCVASYNSLNTNVTVTDPIMLSGEGVISWTEYYSVTPVNIEPDEETAWVENAIPDEFYTSGPHYLWNVTKIDYDSDRTVVTQPIMIMSSPNAIYTIECMYGQSLNVLTEPNDWYADKPDDFIVLWKKETTKFTNSDPRTTVTPIAVKGSPGVDILAQVDEDKIIQWTIDNMQSFDSDEYYLKKGIVVNNDLYIWNGSRKPNWTNNRLYVNSKYYWIIIQDAFVTKVQADWTENNDSMPGYIKNKPINIYDRTITGSVDRGGNIEGVSNIDGGSNIWFEISPHEEILEVEMELSKDNVNGGENTIIKLTKIDCEGFFGPYGIKLTNRGVSSKSSSMTPFADTTIHSYTIKVRKIDLACSNNSFIDLSGDQSSLKLAILKATRNLIPGCKYKFSYNDASYFVTAINNNELDRTCWFDGGTITVDWEKSLFGYSAEPTITYSVHAFGDMIHIDFRNYDDVWYNILTNKFYNDAPSSWAESSTSKASITQYINRWLYITRYKDVRGNEWNAYLNEFSGTYTITFGETCFCNKVDIYLTGAGTNVINISGDSNNNTFVCYNGANITCNNSVGNSINTYNVTNQMTITNSHLNRVSLYNNQTFDLDNANCNIVNVRSTGEFSKLKLYKINNNLITLYNLETTLEIKEKYSGCGIFSINAFKNKTPNTSSIYATDVYDL